MNTTKELTGYPSIDKPWLKYYSDEAIHSKIPECTMYEAIYENNKDHLQDIALNYFGHRITYGELLANIEKTAKAFWNLGIRSGDVVMLCLVNMPETVYTIYALNRLGAIINLVHPPKSEHEIAAYFSGCEISYVVTIGAVYPVLRKLIAKLKIKSVVIPVANAMPFITKTIYKLKNNKTDMSLEEETILWKDFLNKGKGASPKYASYQKDRCFILAHTGGTTGSPKTVMLSDDNLNSVMQGYQYLGIPFERKHTYFNDLPPFIIYGLTLAIHVTLSYGLEVILYPMFNSKGFPKQFRKYRPNHFSALTDHLEYLADSSLLQKMDLHFLVSAGVGGDTVNEKIERKVNTFLKEHNCSYQVCKGYGMTELAGTAVNTTPVANAIGSVGIPLIHNTVKIMKLDSEDEATYDELGEIWISGPSIMLGYYYNDDATEKIITIDEAGQRWIHTGDLGYISKDGLLFHKGRIRRIYLTSAEGQPAKIFPVRIEEVINTLDEVENCAVVGRHVQNSQYYEAVGFVVLKEEISTFKQMIDKLTQTCEKELPFYMVPVAWHFVNELPRTPVGKVDFRKLEDEAEKGVR